METRFERDELQRELKRIQRDIQALQDERELQRDITHSANDGPDVSDALVNELLRSSEHELKESTKTQFDLPLPVPAELETEDRMNELLQVSEEALGGLKLHAITRDEKDNSWILNGACGLVEFRIQFRTIKDGERTIVRDFELKKIPQDCVSEITPLMELAKARSCVRTWLVGISEYVLLLEERESAFAEIRAQAPYGSCRAPEHRVQNYIEIASDDNQKVFRFVWEAGWTLLPENYEPNEFLKPRIYLKTMRGFTAREKSVLEDPEALAPLARKHGLVSAVIMLIKRLYE